MRRFTVLLALAAAAATGALWSRHRQAEAASVRAAAEARGAELAARDADIAFYARRSTEDPRSAADLSTLAALYLQRGRETGDFADFERAEVSARRALALRSARNGRARLTLASSLLARHRFAEALAEAERLTAADPDVPGYRALLGEVQLELGRYEAARATFDSIWPHRRDLAVAPRLARWAEIEGRTDDARRLLLAARDEAVRRRDLPREQLAWFHLRVADLELRHGRLDDAERALRAGLAASPADARLRSAEARLAAARGDWRRVAAVGSALGDGADIATIALVGDAYRALGDPARADSLYARADALGLGERREPYNRQWTLFRLDHDIDIPGTLALLRRELAARPDVYGYDQLAWALYRSGDLAGARQASRQALSLGTDDAMLRAHADEIERGQ